MLQVIQMQSSCTKQATWFWLCTATHLIWTNNVQGAEQEGIFTFGTTNHSPQTMGQSSTWQPSSKHDGISRRDGTGCSIHQRTKAVPIQKTLEELGHLQPPTLVQTDNSTAHGVIKNTIQPNATKPIDMRLHWLRDHMNQKQFWFFWWPGTKNYGGYWTKHHPAAHHRRIRPELLRPSPVLEALRRVAMNKAAATVWVQVNTRNIIRLYLSEQECSFLEQSCCDGVLEPEPGRQRTDRTVSS